MAVATGAIVANLYYLQPVLHSAAASLHVGSGAAGSLVTLTQLGYAAGLLLVVPLGDLHPRRHLVVTLVLLAALAALLAAAAPSFLLFGAASLGLGALSVGGQVMIPFAADLAPEARRGRVVGRMMTGLLTGILLSRTLSGLVAEAIGWRGVYVVAAGLMVLMAALLWWALPEEPRRPHERYRALVAGSLAMLVTLPELRRRALLGALGFAAFSVLWTTLAFHLAAAPFDYSSGWIGAFGLLGVAGALAANVAGALADRGRQAATTVLCALLIGASFLLLGVGGGLLVAIVVAIIALDLGVQGLQITNQSIIYALAPTARSRITSAYMVCYFLGGAAGSLAGGVAFGIGGWTLTCIVGAGIGAVLLLAALVLGAHRRTPVG
jgi:predicted MFS family arabinose efflux permease